MSDYWVSKKKYFCKYCDIYIADDAPSRQQHENGLRHKGNVERFIRGIYKAGEKQKKDLEEEKREMKRVEQAAAAAFAQDVGAGLAKAQGPVASTSAAPKKPIVKPSNPYANYSTAQSLGYSDPDAERLAAELELRRSQGIAGEWQVITPPQPPVGSAAPTPDSTETLVEIGVKREADIPPDEEDTRAFKLRKKTVATGLGEIYDPGLLPIKIKKREASEEPKAGRSGIVKPTVSQAPAPGPLKWTTTQWKRPGDAAKESKATTDLSVKQEDDVKQEDLESGLPGESSTTTTQSSKWSKPQWSEPLPGIKQEDRQAIFRGEEQTDKKPIVKTEPDVKMEEIVSPLSEAPSSSGGSLFKKRKTPAGANRGRREI
ncbi:hypothetical protein BJ912DRAFT_845851 [Pholiota molesta]|nr:hypothetical protein BJ912DRAFT_845851 [Pholiota molesta]